MMDRTLKAISLLLSYPTAEMQDGMAHIGAVIEGDARLTADLRADLQPLLTRLGQGDLYDVQENYVMLFDRSRTLSLNLFEHVHGESRDRGGAMVSLMETYRAAGFEPATEAGVTAEDLADRIDDLEARVQAQNDLLEQQQALVQQLVEELRER